VTNLKKLYNYSFFGNFFFERSIWMVYLLSLNFTLFQIGLFQTILNMTMMITEVPTGIIGDKAGKRNSLIMGNICIIIYYLFLLISDSSNILIMGYVLYGIGLSFISGSDQALLYENTKVENGNYQKNLGLYSGLAVMGLAISSLLGGKLQYFSWDYIFIGGILFQILSIFILLSLKKDSSKVSENKPNIIAEFKVLIKSNKSLKYLLFSIAIFQAVLSTLFNFGQALLSQNTVETGTIAVIYTIISVLGFFLMIYTYKFTTKVSNNFIIMSSFI